MSDSGVQLKTRRQARTKTSARVHKKLDAALGEIEHAELVRRLPEAEGAYLFKHALVQDTAYESMLKHDRKELHREVAVALERSYPEQLDENAARLAQHYAEAGDEAKALTYATRAADRASRLYANDEALTFFSQALSIAKRQSSNTAQLIHLYLGRGRVLEVVGRFAEAISEYGEMEEVARERNDRALELASLIQQAMARSTPVKTFDAKLGQELADRALTLARELGDRAAEAKILWILLILSIHTSQPEQAIEYGEQALAIAQALNKTGYDMREQIAYIMHDLSTPYIAGFNPARGVAYGEESRQLWRDVGNKPMLADNLGMAGQFALGRGDLEAAIAFTTEGAAVARSVGNWFGVFFNLSFKAFGLVELGDFEAAWQIGNELMQISDEAGGLNVAMAGSTQVWLLASLGFFGSASEIERWARRDLTRPMPKHFVVRVYATLARSNILRGALAAAEEDIAASERSSDPNTMLYAAVELALAKAEFALAKENPEHAILALDPFLDGDSAFGMPVFFSELLFARGKALAQEGKIDDAVRTWEDALGRAEEMKLRRMLWQILAALSKVESERGNETRAAKFRARGREVVGFIAAHSPEQFRETFLNLLPVRHMTKTGGEQETAGPSAL